MKTFKWKIGENILLLHRRKLLTGKMVKIFYFEIVEYIIKLIIAVIIILYGPFTRAGIVPGGHRTRWEPCSVGIMGQSSHVCVLLLLVRPLLLFGLYQL